MKMRALRLAARRTSDLSVRFCSIHLSAHSHPNPAFDD